MVAWTQKVQWGWLILVFYGCKPAIQERPSIPPTAASEIPTPLNLWTPGSYAWNGSWQSPCLSDHDDESYQKVWTFHGEQVQVEWQMYINDPCDTLGHTLRFRGTWSFSESPVTVPGTRGIHIRWHQMEVTPQHEDVVTLFNEMDYCRTGSPWKLGEPQVLQSGPCFFEKANHANQNQLIGLQDGMIFVGDENQISHPKEEKTAQDEDLPQRLEMVPYRKTVAIDWR